MPEIKIESLSAGHARALNALTRGALAESPAAFTSDPGQIRNRPLSAVVNHLKELEDSTGFRLGAFNDKGELVGSVRLNPRSGVKMAHGADVLFLYVKPEYRRQGIGLALMKSLIDAARRIDGLEQLELAVSRGSDAAIKLYESLGFETCGIIPRQIRIDDEYHDLVAMWKSL